MPDGAATEVRAHRAATLDVAAAAGPARFHHRRPQPSKLSTTAWTNEPLTPAEATQQGSEEGVANPLRAAAPASAGLDPAWRRESDAERRTSTAAAAGSIAAPKGTSTAHWGWRVSYLGLAMVIPRERAASSRRWSSLTRDPRSVPSWSALARWMASSERRWGPERAGQAEDPVADPEQVDAPQEGVCSSGRLGAFAQESSQDFGPGECAGHQRPGTCLDDGDETAGSTGGVSPRRSRE